MDPTAFNAQVSSDYTADFEAQLSTYAQANANDPNINQEVAQMRDSFYNGTPLPSSLQGALPEMAGAYRH